MSNRKIFLVTVIILDVFLFSTMVGCKRKVSISPALEETMIRLKDETHTGLTVLFIALSKNIDFSTLAGLQQIAYDKYDSDWFIDGSDVPFVTEYKQFDLDEGNYYCLFRGQRPNASLASTFEITVLQGKQTWVLNDHREIRIERP